MQGIASTPYDDEDVSKVDVVSGTTFPSNVIIKVHVHADMPWNGPDDHRWRKG